MANPIDVIRGQVIALLVGIGLETAKQLPGLLQAIRNGDPDEAARRARRAALAGAAKASIRRGTR